MNKKQKVLVTGANGLLGSNTIETLLLNGYNVVAFVRKNADLEALSELNCEIFEGNLSNIKDLNKALGGCDYVIHAAARTAQFPSNLKAYEHINIECTKILIECCKTNNIKRFIFASTANCFTHGTIENPGNETSNFMPWLKKSGYAYSKYLAQQLVLREVEKNNFPAIIIAPTFMLGPRDTKPSSGQLVLHGLKNWIVFYPPGGKSFVDISYAAQAITNALQNGRIGQCYLVAGENTSYKLFFQKLRNLSHKKQLLIGIPRWLISAVGILFSCTESIFSISLPFNQTTQKLLCLPNYFSNLKAKTELGLKNTDIEKTLKTSIDWFNSRP